MYVCRFRQPAGSICIPPRWAAPPGKGPFAARRLYARAMTVTGRTSRPYASKPPRGSVPAGGIVTGSLSWTGGGAGRASQLADSRAGQSARMVPGQPTPKREALLNAGAFPGASRVPVGCFALFGSSIGYHTGRALSEGVTHRSFRYVFCFLRHARRARALMRVGALSGFDLGRPRSALAKPCGKKPSLHRSSAGTCSCSCSCWLPRSARAKPCGKRPSLHRILGPCSCGGVRSSRRGLSGLGGIGLGKVGYVGKVKYLE